MPKILPDPSFVSTLCVGAKKTLARLSISAGLFEPLVLAYAICSCDTFLI